MKWNWRIGVTCRYGVVKYKYKHLPSKLEISPRNLKKTKFQKQNIADMESSYSGYSSSSYTSRSCCSSNELALNDTRMQTYRFHKRRLLHTENSTTKTLLESLQYTLTYIPLSEIVHQLAPTLKNAQHRSLLLQICLTCATGGRKAVREAFQHDSLSWSIVNTPAFICPFSFSDTPFALIGHLILASGKLVCLPEDRPKIETKFGGKKHIWEINYTRQNSFSVEIYRSFALQRPVNLYYAKWFSDKLHQPGDYDSYDIQSLIEIAIKVECS